MAKKKATDATADESRSCALKVWLTEDERQKIKLAALLNNSSATDFARLAVMQHAEKCLAASNSK